MSTVDYIRGNIEMSKWITLNLLNDMKDAPLTAPTATGGNHPLWVLGHLAYSEANIINHLIQGKENPLEEWKDLFAGGSEPVDDANHYPSFDEVAQAWEDTRAATLQFLDGLTDEGLAGKAKNCPPDSEQIFGTIGACFQIINIHPTMHYGQVADARRSLNRQPVLA